MELGIRNGQTLSGSAQLAAYSFFSKKLITKNEKSDEGIENVELGIRNGQTLSGSAQLAAYSFFSKKLITKN